MRLFADADGVDEQDVLATVGEAEEKAARSLRSSRMEANQSESSAQICSKQA